MLLEFFRCGALAHLARTRSGAPEELLLTTALRPLDFPGGMLGSSLRRALEPRQIGQLVRCVELAVLCFRRAAEFGESDLAAYWQAIVFRGIGGFSECRELAKDALLDRPGSALAGVVNAIGAYLVDFQELRNISAVAGATQNGWVQPLVLDSVAPLCELLDGDPFLSRTKSRHMATLGGVEGIILASRATTLEPPHRSQTLLPFTARTGSVACRVLGGPTS